MSTLPTKLHRLALLDHVSRLILSRNSLISSNFSRAVTVATSREKSYFVRLNRTAATWSDRVKIGFGENDEPRTNFHARERPVYRRLAASLKAENELCC